MSITIKSEVFGELVIPRDGYDKQSLLEKYLDEIRSKDKEYKSEDGETVFMDKHNRVVVETAIRVGWLATFDVENESPKKIAWLARGITDYVIDCTTVSPN